MDIVIRLICLIIGYGFGLIETGVIYGKIKGVDIRQHGSHNLGTTNALRVLGPKAGLIVFIGDFCKGLIPTLVANLAFRGMYPDSYLLYALYVGLGAVLGHGFPFYLKFKGGKGVATTGGMIVGLLQPWIILILLVIFVGAVAITKYVSFGSILLMAGFTIGYLIVALAGGLCFGGLTARFWESFVIVAIISGLSIYKHRENIGRLIRHEENKLSFKTKGSINENK